MCFRNVCCLGSIGEANTIVTQVELSVVASNEHIAQDPEWSIWRWNIDSHETAQADCFSHLIDAQNVVNAFELKWFSTECEFDCRQIWNLVTSNDVLAVDDWSSTDQLIDLFDFIQWSGNQAGACVSDRLASILAEWLVTNHDGVHFELPICFTINWHVSEVAFVVLWIGTTENDFATFFALRITIQVEREDWVFDESLVVQIVKRWCDVINGNRAVAQTENSVEFRGNEN